MTEVTVYSPDGERWYTSMGQAWDQRKPDLDLHGAFPPLKTKTAYVNEWGTYLWKDENGYRRADIIKPKL